MSAESSLSTTVPPTNQRKKIDFSIDGILKVPYISSNSNKFNRGLHVQQHLEGYQHPEVPGSFLASQNSPSEDRNGDSDESKDFPWLYCSRFKPPKLPRSKKRNNLKRYGRGPRIPFAAHQITVLENAFKKSHYLSPDCIHRLADSLYLSETRVKIWFQNRRARFRREQDLSSLNPAMVDPMVNSNKLSAESSGELATLMAITTKGSLKKVRRRPNVSSCDDEEMEVEVEDKLNEELPSAKLTYNVLSPDLLFNPACSTAVNHFSRILHGSSSSAFVPLRK